LFGDNSKLSHQHKNKKSWIYGH